MKRRQNVGNPGLLAHTLPFEERYGTTWRPSLGAWVDGNGARFRVWAPEVDHVDVVLFGESAKTVPLEQFGDGTWGTWVDDIGVGTRYQFHLPVGTFPDPTSRFQPKGVHGPSEIKDFRHYSWNDQTWRGPDRDHLVLYELHVGTFSPEGTFQGLRDRLDYFVELGVNALELMPIADFPGDRNWGYDGASLFAPARCYGSPDDLRDLVDAAHSLGISIFLDVVYNHLGPDGNYLSQFSPHYFTPDRSNPWGAALNFDGPYSEMVRRFFVENAMMWIHEYHIDGLRLDATDQMEDRTAIPIVAEIATRVRNSLANRSVVLIAEDHRNLADIVRPEGAGGWGLDGVWSDDFHHGVRVALAGDNEGYYRDYEGSMSQLAETLNQGWFYAGRFSERLSATRGTDSSGIPPRRFVFCIQNHDQIGNRALGDRLHHQIDAAAYRAASVLLLCSPATPLLFMGQEWAASSPFLFFTDHSEELGKLVTEGRRKEFQQFQLFRDEAMRELIPDPQVKDTFRRSKLDWSDLENEPHRSMFWLYRDLLSIRHSEIAIRNASPGSFRAWALSETTLLLRQDAEFGGALIAIIQMNGEVEIDLTDHPALEGLTASRCRLMLTTEDPPFSPNPNPPVVELDRAAPRIRFPQPAGVLLRAMDAHVGTTRGVGSSNP